ncbi:hypothetical protein BK816_03260 [Boudabousia tangfeifanii]|uniref:Signal transduction histidine-protein kinase/phosphatase MprB n=1 Tax=Boudabousia tangfeifanii TaxID=1912795 RepID=A0A1D9MJR4_9ACTO|nr:HAMP domain-containing sensor histidine kinase [Boudabousia tangfeifanii]AOZ72429.1 hypothetical protein BK816_03260 [Boudabousia tangfeifanii]
MLQRLLRMTVTALLVAVILFALPAAIVGSTMVWRMDKEAFEMRIASIAKVVEGYSAKSFFRDEVLLEHWRIDGNQPLSHLEWKKFTGEDIEAGEKQSWPTMEYSVELTNGDEIIAQRDASDTVEHIFYLNLIIAGGVVVVLAVGYLISRRGARRLSAPLIFLAAQAEQIGSGQARGTLPKSGIEEIDLVQEELARTAERMAARIAQERQFSRDVSHQIRTPLTALGLRLEEIEYITDQDEVREEARASIAQVERLTEVVQVLLSKASNRRAGSAQSLSVLEIFAPMREEWEESFSRVNRELIIQDDSTGNVMVTPAVLSQVLATLLENSLKYGAGTTTVVAAGGSQIGSSFHIDVMDEGPGVDDEIAEKIFEKGFSGKGSSGLGLGIAKDLLASDGGSIQLYRRRPPCFRISLLAAPTSNIKESEAFVAAGRRHSHLN